MDTSRESLLVKPKICEALRDHFRGCVSTNPSSWGSGDATP
jgi:hypothetical protein